MVAPTTLASSLTAAAALLTLTPGALALPATAPAAAGALSARGIFDPTPAEYKKDIFGYHSDQSNGYEGFSDGKKTDDWFAAKDTRREMDKIRPNRFDKPQKPRPYDEYDGGPAVKKHSEADSSPQGSSSGVIVPRKENLDVNLGPLKIKIKFGLPSISDIKNWWRFKAAADETELPVYQKPHPEWYDRYAKTLPPGNVRRRDVVPAGSDEEEEVVATATPDADTEAWTTLYVPLERLTEVPKVTTTTTMTTTPTPTGKADDDAEPTFGVPDETIEEVVEPTTPTPTPTTTAVARTGGSCPHHPHLCV